MKKSTFTALILGTISGVLFAIGMCMTLLPEWNAFEPGIIFGTVGIGLGLITAIVWRKTEHKKPIKLNFRAIAICLFGILGALVFGIGLCFCMVWEKFVIGTIMGLFGIFLLLLLIPITKGLK